MVVTAPSRRQAWGFSSCTSPGTEPSTASMSPPVFAVGEPVHTRLALHRQRFEDRPVLAAA